MNGVEHTQTTYEPDEMEIDSEPVPPRPSMMTATTPDVDRLCTRCSTGYSPRWWPIESRRMGQQRPLLNGMGPYPPSFGVPEAPLYECHKCHLNGPPPAPAPAPVQGPPGPSAAAAPAPGPGPVPVPAPQTTATPEPRPAYTTPTQRPVLPAPRFEYSQPYAPTHATPPSVLPRPTPTPGPEWHPGYEHSMSVGYSPGPPPGPPVHHHHPAPPHHAPAPPPPPPHLNGYHPAPPAPYTNGMPPGPPPPGPPGPPPQAFPTHSPYGTVVPSPHRTPVIPRPYASSASPPDVPATMVRHSPQHSLSTSTLNGSAGGVAAAAPRIYSGSGGERVLSAPVASSSSTSTSPPVTQSQVSPPVGRMGETIPGASRGRHGSVSVGAAAAAGGSSSTGATGASASPSLKNLLS